MFWGRKAEAVKEAAEAKGAAVAEAFRHVSAGDLDKAKASLSAEGLGVPQALRERQALGALAIGACAFGAVAIGAFAIGRLSVGRMSVGDARIGKLTIGELEVQSLTRPEFVDRIAARLPAWR